MGCPVQARTKARTQNSRRNAATGTPDGGRTAEPAARAAYGGYSFCVRQLQCPCAAATVPDVRWLQCPRAVATVPARGGYSVGARWLQCLRAAATVPFFFCFLILKSSKYDAIWHKNVLKDPSLCSDTTVGDNGGSGSRFPGAQRNTCVTLNDSGIQLAMGTQPLWLRNRNFGLAQRIMVKRLETSPNDPLGITDSACKNQSVMVSVQYGPFNTYIPIRSTTIGKSRVARDPITMHTSWRSNSDITSVTRQTHLPKTHPVLWPEIYHTIISSDSIGYPRMKSERYKKEDRYNRDDKSDERAVDRPKERYKDRRMRTRGDKRSSRKHDRKVLVAEESTKSWADTDSESSSSSSSSSDSEQDEVHCLMADQTSDDELQESQKPANDRTGLGFNSSDSSEGETSTQSQLAHDKLNKMSFVKANVVYDPCESMTYNDQIPQKLKHKVKAGIGFQKPENSKPSWLKNKLDKDKEKAGRKSFVPNQSWRSSKKVLVGKMFSRKEI
ncbi:hypothetical protein F511_34788 [Dorcoceras hygrometricum]|uniref:Uncharacterized protein n=1 Tax=Dorcoceras hygrometricum TaxID=472368 RepID=A0A2Z7BVI9_9LAMI|nr:hypothetical protein F511_34788 [Dorcoceras hygrometricum]